MNWIAKLFHNHNYKTVEIPHSNKKGEIWIQECRCGKRIEVLFDSNDNCMSIKKLN